MSSFYRFETKEFTLNFTPNGVLDGYSKIVVSLAQSGIEKVSKTNDDLVIDVTNNKIIVDFSQEDTSLFRPGEDAELQVNIYYENTERDVSKKATIKVLDNLHKKIMGGSDNE